MSNIKVLLNVLFVNVWREVVLLKLKDRVAIYEQVRTATCSRYPAKTKPRPRELVAGRRKLAAYAVFQNCAEDTGESADPFISWQ